MVESRVAAGSGQQQAEPHRVEVAGPGSAVGGTHSVQSELRSLRSVRWIVSTAAFEPGLAPSSNVRPLWLRSRGGVAVTKAKSATKSASCTSLNGERAPLGCSSARPSAGGLPRPRPRPCPRPRPRPPWRATAASMVPPTSATEAALRTTVSNWLSAGTKGPAALISAPVSAPLAFFTTTAAFGGSVGASRCCAPAAMASTCSSTSALACLPSWLSLSSLTPLAGAMSGRERTRLLRCLA